MSSAVLDIVRAGLVGVQWYSHILENQAGASWYELFGYFLISTHVFPAVVTKDGDQLREDSEDIIVYTHTLAQGMPTWRRYIAFLDKRVPQPAKMTHSKPLGRWNRKGPGLQGRIRIAQDHRETLMTKKAAVTFFVAMTTNGLVFPYGLVQCECGFAIQAPCDSISQVTLNASS